MTQETTRTWWCEGCQDGATPATHLIRDAKTPHVLTEPGLTPYPVEDEFFCTVCFEELRKRGVLADGR